MQNEPPRNNTSLEQPKSDVAAWSCSTEVIQYWGVTLIPDGAYRGYTVLRRYPDTRWRRRWSSGAEGSSWRSTGRRDRVRHLNTTSALVLRRDRVGHLNTSSALVLRRDRVGHLNTTYALVLWRDRVGHLNTTSALVLHIKHWLQLPC